MDGLDHPVENQLTIFSEFSIDELFFLRESLSLEDDAVIYAVLAYQILHRRKEKCCFVDSKILALALLSLTVAMTDGKFPPPYLVERLYDIPRHVLSKVQMTIYRSLCGKIPRHSSLEIIDELIRRRRQDISSEGETSLKALFSPEVKPIAITCLRDLIYTVCAKKLLEVSPLALGCGIICLLLKNRLHLLPTPIQTWSYFDD